MHQICVRIGYDRLWGREALYYKSLYEQFFAAVLKTLRSEFHSKTLGTRLMDAHVPNFQGHIYAAEGRLALVRARTIIKNQ